MSPFPVLARTRVIQCQADPIQTDTPHSYRNGIHHDDVILDSVADFKFDGIGQITRQHIWRHQPLGKRPCLSVIRMEGLAIDSDVEDLVRSTVEFDHDLGPILVARDGGREIMRRRLRTSSKARRA
jgi:hypothetical protein